MKKVFLAVCAGIIGLVSYGQQGTTKIGVGADLGIPSGDFDAFKTGFGGYAKGLFGIGTAGQITFTTGYTAYKMKGSTSSDKITATIIPILAGYRHNFSGFFVEPQVGYGIYGAKVKTGGISASNSDGAFTWAAGVGYVINDAIELGARYQSGHKDGSSTSLIGIHVGYNFSLGGQ